MYRVCGRESSEPSCCGVLAGTHGTVKLEECPWTGSNSTQQLVPLCFKMQLLYGVEFIHIRCAAKDTCFSLFRACNTTI